MVVSVAVAACEVVCDCVGEGLWLLDAVCACDGVAACVPEAVAAALPDALCEGVTVDETLVDPAWELLGDGLGVAVAELVPDCDRESEAACVGVPVLLGEADGVDVKDSDGVPLVVAACEGEPEGVRDSESDTVELGVKDSEPEMRCDIVCV